MKRHFFIAILFCLGTIRALTASLPHKMITADEYLVRYKEEAVAEMLKHGIPASITLAQAMLESSYGNSPLAQYANNHFGIKCHENWAGSTYSYDDDEKNECFRSYSNPTESFHDHSLFLKNRPRYSFLFNYSKTDYKSWAKGLKEAGYATNPKYASLLIELIERFQLFQLDSLDKMELIPPPVPSLALLKEKEKTSLKTDSLDIKTHFGLHEIYDKIVIHFTQHNLFHLNHHESAPTLTTEKPIVSEIELQQLAVAKKTLHIVGEGETVKSIARNYGIKARDLYQLNSLKRDQRLIPGEILIIFLATPPNITAN